MSVFSRHPLRADAAWGSGAFMVQSGTQTKDELTHVNEVVAGMMRLRRKPVGHEVTGVAVVREEPPA